MLHIHHISHVPAMSQYIIVTDSFRKKVVSDTCTDEMQCKGHEIGNSEYDFSLGLFHFRHEHDM